MKTRLFLLMMLLLVLLGLSVTVMAAEPEYGGTLTIGTNKIQPSLDPHHDMGFGGFEKYVAFDTLISYDQELNFQPELAISWEIPDNTTYIFHLRKGVTFHDGTNFNAEAVKWNIERLQSDYSQASSYFTNVKSVNVLDDYIVEFKLKEPYAPFLDSLAGNGLMVSPAAVKKMGNEAFQKHPVGTGPFVFDHLDTQKGELVFTGNKNYWKKGQPYLNKLVFKEIPEGQTRLFALQTGKIDYAYPLPSSNIETLKQNDKVNLISVLSKSNTIDYLTFNCTKKPFDDVRVRKAVRLALDKEKIVNFLSQTEPLSGPLPNASWGSNPDKKTPGYNPEKAKQLLQEAGYPHGFDVTLKVWSNDPRRSDLAVVTKDMLAKVGIKVKVEVLEVGTLIQQMRNGNFTFASLHWGGGGSLDPNGNLYVLFDSHSVNNFISNYHNEDIDQYLEEALLTTDRQKRQQLYWKVEQKLIDDQPMVWFGRFAEYIGYSDRVHGIDPLRPAGYFPKSEHLWVSQ